MDAARESDLPLSLAVLKDLGDALLTERARIRVGDHAAAEDERVTKSTVAELLLHPRKQRQMRTRQQRQPDRVGVLLEYGFGDLLGCLV